MYWSSGDCELNKSAMTLSEGSERMKTLRFTSSATEVILENASFKCL